MFRAYRPVDITQQFVVFINQSNRRGFGVPTQRAIQRIWDSERVFERPNHQIHTPTHRQVCSTTQSAQTATHGSPTRIGFDVVVIAAANLFSRSHASQKADFVFPENR
jgi:hypothetical protein